MKIEKIVKRILNEKFDSLDDVISFGDFASLFSKSDLKKINKFLLLIRESGIVNMYQAGEFIGMSLDCFRDYIRLERHRKNIDEDIIEQIEELILDVRNIVIGASIKKLENQEKDVTVRTVSSALKTIIHNIMVYYMRDMLPK